MPCPFLIGMNPSPCYPDEPWHMDADSTKIVAEFALGDPELTWCLDYGLDMDNLNETIPPRVGGEIVVDEIEARLRLDAWAADGRLLDRDVVLLGNDVADVFCAWAEVAPLDNVEGSQRRNSPKLGGAELSLVRIPHPSRILRLREDGSEYLEWTENRFGAVRPLYDRGEEIKRFEAFEVDRQIILEDERVAETLAIHTSNMLLEMEEAEEEREHLRLIRRQEREDRRWDAEQYDLDDFD